MKSIILAGGFAKRMYPITEICPKPLLPIVGKPIIQYIIEKLENVEEIDSIIISTNKRFKEHFSNWLSHFRSNKHIKLVIENSNKEEEKLGAIGALGFLIKNENIDNDVLIVAGDNLFDFSLVDFVKSAKKRNSALVAFYDMQDKAAVAGRYGIGVLDADSRITNFEEKPENPSSALVSTACYYIKKDDLGLLFKYLKNKNNPDAPGFFIKWLAEQNPVYGFTFSGRWFDIGKIESYREASLEYEKRLR